MAKDKTPDEIETALRKSAEKFGSDLTAARAAGLVVTWPARPEGLASLEISASGAALASEEQPTDLTPVPGSKAASVAAGVSTESSAAKA